MSGCLLTFVNRLHHCPSRCCGERAHRGHAKWAADGAGPDPAGDKQISLDEVRGRSCTRRGTARTSPCPTGHGRSARTNDASAAPISSGLSSWRKCIPGAVTSVWLGQVRRNSRTRPVTVEPGSPLMNSLGPSLCDGHAPYSSTVAATSAGSPSIGMLRGHANVGRRSSPGLRNGARIHCRF
jgi:hypothetical protein